jgi:uncharacterized protein
MVCQKNKLSGEQASKLFMNLIEKITQKAKELLSVSKGSHDWDHTLRVYNTCLQLARSEGADEETIMIAALLHDIGRHTQDVSGGKVCHAEVGAKMATDLLSEYELDQSKKDNIIHCIATHRFRNSLTPESLEAKVLFDSDKLDAIGAVGIGRAFLFAGEHGAKLHDRNVDINRAHEYSREDTAYREYMFKLRKVKERMLTESGRKLAQSRHDFMVEFFDRLNREVDGKN